MTFVEDPEGWVISKIVSQISMWAPMDMKNPCYGCRADILVVHRTFFLGGQFVHYVSGAQIAAFYLSPSRLKLFKLR